MIYREQTASRDLSTKSTAHHTLPGIEDEDDDGYEDDEYGNQ